jgi:hypothetical protein
MKRVAAWVGTGLLLVATGPMACDDEDEVGPRDAAVNPARPLDAGADTAPRLDAAADAPATDIAPADGAATDRTPDVSPEVDLDAGLSDPDAMPVVISPTSGTVPAGL